MGAGQSKVQMWDERTKQDPEAEDKVEGEVMEEVI